ncbi:MAG: cupin domain-containing protein [Pseudomonadota bacterium]
MPADPTKLPMSIAQSYLEGEGLTVIDPSTAQADEGITTEAPINYSTHLFHEGKISAYVFETDPGTVQIDGLPYDEYVHVLEGRLILTPKGGEPQEFKAGDHLLIPEGYVGTWHMPEKYREFVVINTLQGAEA